MLIHIEILFKQKITFIVLFLCRYPGKFTKDFSRKNPHAEHCSIFKFECYLNELLSSQMNNVSSMHKYKEYNWRLGIIRGIGLHPACDNITIVIIRRL